VSPELQKTLVKMAVGLAFSVVLGYLVKLDSKAGDIIDERWMLKNTPDPK